MLPLSENRIRLMEYGSWFLDPSGEADIANIRNESFSCLENTSFGSVKGTLWGKYSFKTSEALSFIMYSSWNKADRIDLYLVRADGSVEHSRTDLNGDTLFQGINYRRPAFEINMSEGEEIDCYIRIQSSGSVIMDFYGASFSSFFISSLKEEWFLFFYFGATCIIAFYNLMVFVVSKDRNYLLYFLYVIFMLLYQFSVEGYGNFLIWQDWFWFRPRSYNFFISLAFCTGLIFTNTYLNLKRHNRVLNHLTLWSAALFFIVGVMFIFTTASWLIDFGTLCILFGMILILICGFYVLSRRYEPAVYFVFAWSVLVAGIFITTAKRLHWLPYNHFTNYALHVGNMLEAILLALALGERVRKNYQKKLEAEEALSEANSRILQNRMKPHFLFNSMNMIFQQLKEEPDQAQITLKKLADNYHFLTDSSERRLIPFKDEWAFLQNYLDIMKSRWPDHLLIESSFQSELGLLPVPPLILQPLVENAFKYGLKHVTNKALRVKCCIKNDRVAFFVENNTDRPLGNIDYSRSLGNIQKRLRRYYRDAVVELSEDDNMVTALIHFAYPCKES